jgi:hypothetical protein
MKRTEQALQINLVSALRLMLPEPWLVVHVPNGGGRSKAEAGIFKAMGVLAGFPDLLVIGPGGWIYPTIPQGKQQTAQVVAIELKAPHKMLKSGKPSKAKANLSVAQRDVIATLGQCGIPTLVVRDLNEAIDALRALGVPLRGRAL